MDSGEFSSVCQMAMGDAKQHNNTQEHKLQFKLWEFQNLKQSMVNSSYGVELHVNPQIPEGLEVEFVYHKKEGTYFATILIEHLKKHNNTLTFNCSIENSGKNTVLITSGGLLHPTDFFTVIEESSSLQNHSVVLLDPGTDYKFSIEFSLREITIGSFKVTFACNFQTTDNNTFTIARSIVTKILDQKEETKVHIKSPFTCQPWDNISQTVPSVSGKPNTNEYSIPRPYYQILKFELKQFTGMTEAEECTRQTLQDYLGPQKQVDLLNYGNFWHIMLWMEEMSENIMLRRFNMENVNIQLKRGNYKGFRLLIPVPGLAERRPSLILGDMIKVRVHNDHKAYIGVVKQIFETSIEIEGIHKELINYMKRLPNAGLDVQFVLSRVVLGRMHRGIDQLTKSGMVTILFPKNEDEVVDSPIVHDLTDSDFYNEDIVNNQEQKNAIVKIVNSTQKYPYIVYGPPGTGKTVTIVEAIMQLKKLTQKKILVCASSNAASDFIATKLIKYCSKTELIRIHATCRERCTITPDLMKYSNIGNDQEIISISDVKINTYRIVVATLALVGKYRRGYAPDCLFIDEAAQASEPEIGIALGIMHVGSQVILAGDPKQLGPMALSKVAEDHGLGTSLLERLMDFDIYKSHNDNFITMLKQNFRSHSQILEISNELFYDNLLVPVALPPKQDPLVHMAIYPRIELYKANDVEETQETVGGNHALEFCSVSFKEQREGSSPSFFNLAETKMVVEYVKTLLHMNLEQEHLVTKDQIGVVTPYRRQFHKIKLALKDAGFHEVEVGTTESFQGREKRVIIISTVRAQHCYLGHDRTYKLGFVNSEKRFNVALTRAISKLIVIGCPTVLTTSPMWSKYIELCEKHGTYFGSPYQKRDDEFANDVVEKMRFLAIGKKSDNVPH